MADGLHHNPNCPCRRCIGSRVKQRAGNRERKVGKALGGNRNIGSGAFGGHDTTGTLCAIEETAHQAIVRGLKRWWYSKQVSEKFGKVMAQKAQPAAAVLSWEGKAQLVVMRFADFVQLCALIQDGDQDLRRAAEKAHTELTAALRSRSA